MPETKEEHEKLWRSRLADWRASGKSQREWCSENNCSRSTLKYWSRKVNKENAQKNMPNWIDLEIDKDKIARVPISSSSKTVEVKIGMSVITFSTSSEVVIKIC